MMNTSHAWFVYAGKIKVRYFLNRPCMINVQTRPECWASQGSLSFSPWKSVCHDWTATDATHNCMPGCENIVAVRANWLISVCGFCLSGIRSWKSYEWWFPRMKEFVNLLQRCWLGETGPIPWPGGSCEFTALDNVFWDYIRPFGILLMETHTEIEHFLRPALVMDCLQHTVVIPFRYFGISSQSLLQGSSSSRRICLDSRQPSLHILDVF